MPGGRGGRSGGGRGPLPRNVQVSKKLSWLLRHGAEQEGLKLDSSGFLNAEDVLNNRNLKSLKVTFEEVRQIVQDSDKQRFTMAPAAVLTQETNGELEVNGSAQQPSIPSPKAKDWLIRANQGHSLKVDSEGLLRPIIADDVTETPVHGTTHAAWLLIVASGGLKPMGRNHVHFATGLPTGFASITDVNPHEVETPVISGMRKSSTVLIFLDLAKALEAGMKFWLSDNGVILSEGNEAGLVPLNFFKKVEDRTGTGVLVENGIVVQEAPASWAAKGNKGKR